MVSINYASREVTCKIVYYGPGLSGKTTNLIYVHKKVPGTTKGKMISLATEADRTLYFDFLPINIGKINGFAAKFQLYTVPGQVYYNATRKLVLRGVDGIVFVADSQADKMDENIESLTNMKENMAEYGYDISEIPVVIQYNKRDLPGALPVEELEAKLNPYGWKSFEAEAVNGPGVFDTLKMIIKLVLDRAKNTRSKPAKPAAVQTPQQAPQPAPAPRPESQPAAPQVEQAPTPAAQQPPTAAKPPIEQPPMERPAAQAPQMQSDNEPEEVPGLVRHEAYDAQVPPKEEITDDTGQIQQAPIQGQVGSQDQATPADEEAVGVNASEAAGNRPFPGSNTARIARRERRITVSDFQPASRDEESSALQGRISEDEKDKKQISDMPTPKMAPSKRTTKKKKGFFKRLFGLK